MAKLSEEQALIMGNSIEMLQKAKKNKAIEKYKEESKKNSPLNIMLATLSTDNDDDQYPDEDPVSTETAPLEVSSEEKAESPKKHKEKFFDISGKIENEISKATKMTIEKETEHIISATVKAISIRTTQKNKQGYDDLVVRALEEVISERTASICDAFFVDIDKDMSNIGANRLDFDKAYSEFLEIMYISKRTEEIGGENAALDKKTLQMKYKSTNGFLSVPLEYYKQSLEAVSLSEELSGKDLRGMEIHSKFLENVAVVNLFKEDIFDIF